MQSIYGNYTVTLKAVQSYLTERLEKYGRSIYASRGESAYEHLESRIKSEESMREKCLRKGLEPTALSALTKIHDAVGVRIICRFVEDVYDVAAYIGELEGCTVVTAKDYIKDVKPNGYRSYHIIVAVDITANEEAHIIGGTYFAEIQLRTIAMDTWASLEHQMKYKEKIDNAEMISRELKRCADELASCDFSMQTIRNLIRRQ